MPFTKSIQKESIMRFFLFHLHYIKIALNGSHLLPKKKKPFSIQLQTLFLKMLKPNLFLVKKGKQVVGRMAAMINWIEVKEQGKTKVRFGWYDTIDDIEVSRLLLDAVTDWGKQNRLTYIEGPMGFSNMDKAGLLVQGYEYLNTMITWYHYPYQKQHLETLGLVKQAEWVEFKIKIFKAEDAPEKVKKYADLIAKRYQLNSLEFSSRKELTPYVDKMFDLLNKTYDKLQSFVPIQPYQVAHYKKKYFSYIHPRFIKCVTDQSGKLIAFAITMPSFSKKLSKSKWLTLPFWIPSYFACT